MAKTEQTTSLTAKSIRQLAAATGRSHSSVLAWLGKADFPVRRQPPWSEAEILRIVEWADAKLSQQSSATPEMRKARIELLKAELAVVNLHCRLAAGVYLKRRDVRGIDLRAIAQTMADLKNLAWTVPNPALKSAGEIEAGLSEQLETILHDHEKRTVGRIQRLPRFFDAGGRRPRAGRPPHPARPRQGAADKAAADARPSPVR